MLSEAAKLQKTRENSNNEFKIVKRHTYLFEPVNNTNLFLKISDLYLTIISTKKTKRLHPTPNWECDLNLGSK
jgi:hypothetical protein